MNKIYITGDIHGNIDYDKISENNWKEQKKLTKDDYLIICGDFGFIWEDTEDRAEKYWLNTINDKNFTTLIVDGNHENHKALNTNYPVKEWNGGLIHEIRPSVLHLMRGQVYKINGKTFFTMGGASSFDKYRRTENISWWKEEIPSQEEYNTALDNLEKYDYKVDYVLTHCCGTRVMNRINPYYEKDVLTNFFDFLEDKCNFKFKHWYFGHYHVDIDIDKRYHGLYKRIIELDE